MDRVPARKPANIDALPESPHFLRHKQMMALKIAEKLPRNIANDALSTEKIRLNNALGFLKIFLSPKTMDTPVLMRYPNVKESQKD
jgi:hypothetical protein